MDTLEPTIEYRPIPNFPGYRVGSDGSVWSCKNNKWGNTAPWRRLATGINCNGYETVGLSQHNQRTLKLVQALVLEGFVGVRPEGMWALHRNDDPLDNRLSNLYWGTHADNIRDAKQNQRFRIGTFHPQGRLAEEEIQQIRQRAAHGETMRAIAADYHISASHVSNIVNGRVRSYATAVIGAETRLADLQAQRPARRRPRSRKPRKKESL